MNVPPFIIGISLLFLVRSTDSAVLAQARDTSLFISEPGAEALYEGMIDAFRTAKTLSFVSRYSFSVDGREMGECMYRVALKKPGYVRMEAFRRDVAVPVGVLTGNRDGFWIHWPMGRPRQSYEDSSDWTTSRERVYMHRSIPPRRYSIAHEAGWLNSCVVMTVVQLSLFHGSPDGLAAEKEGVRVVRREEVNGVACTLIEVNYLKHQRSKLYWLSDRDLLPRKAKDVVRVRRELAATEVWTDVRLNEDIPDDVFAWSPPAGWTQWFSAGDEASLLAPGTEAPDFQCRTLEGGTFRLSSGRGRPVLLNFWRLGCPPCQQEVSALERIHRRFSRQGLLVVGFNCSDDSARVAAFLRSKGISYSNILDTTSAAVDVYAKAFGTNAVPANYLIDRNGRILQRWIGYSEERLAAAIRTLGLR